MADFPSKPNELYAKSHVIASWQTNPSYQHLSPKDTLEPGSGLSFLKRCCFHGLDLRYFTYIIDGDGQLQEIAKNHENDTFSEQYTASLASSSWMSCAYYSYFQDKPKKDDALVSFCGSPNHSPNHEKLLLFHHAKRPCKVKIAQETTESLSSFTIARFQFNAFDLWLEGFLRDCPHGMQAKHWSLGQWMTKRWKLIKSTATPNCLCLKPAQFQPF